MKNKKEGENMIATKQLTHKKITIPPVLIQAGIQVSANLICAIAFNMFYIPNHFLSGGLSGISILVEYLFDIPTAITVFVLNLPLFLIGARKIDGEFIRNTIISVTLFSLLLSLTNPLRGAVQIEDPLLMAIIGGALNGIGMGLLFRHKMSQGGFDIIAAMIKKKRNIEIGTVLMGLNGILILISTFIFDLRSAMYTLVALFISYQVMDRVRKGTNREKTVMIISDETDAIAQSIQLKLNRGMTFLKGNGGYSREEKTVIYTTVSSTQMCTLREIVRQKDENAFMAVTEADEVDGNGFERQWL
jgi:uncharacterized membrane-anchored protein YitT (DUF2179 family)